MSETAAARADLDGVGRVFSPLTVLWIVLASLFSASAFLVLSAYAPDLRGGSDGGAHALSSSAVGFAGAVRLLREQDLPVVISRREPSARDPAWSLTILTPPPEPRNNSLQHYTITGPTLVVLPKWNVVGDPSNQGWVFKDGLIDPRPIEAGLKQAYLTAKIARRSGTAGVRLSAPPGSGAPGSGAVQLTGPIEQLQTLTPGPDFIPYLVDERGQAVVLVARNRKVAILSDPDLLNTHGLKDLRTARVAMGLINALRVGSGPIAFDINLDGFDSPPSLLKLVFSPPFLGATLCLVAAGLLMGLHALGQFAPPRPQGRVIAFGKRALADNSAGLIRLARREPRMAPRYLELSRAAVARALGAGRLGGEELDAYLDRVAEQGAVTGRLGDLAAETAKVKTRADLLRVARDLYHWRLEMTRERR